MKYSEIIKKINDAYIFLDYDSEWIECPFGIIDSSSDKIKRINNVNECRWKYWTNGCEHWIKEKDSDNGKKIYCNLQREKVKKELRNEVFGNNKKDK